MENEYNLSLSNIAWEYVNDEEVAKLLNKYNMHHIDICISKYFNNLEIISNNDLISIKKWWNDRNIKLYGCQSLLYGKSNLNIFSNKETRKELIKYLKKLFNVASTLGIKKLVFGSPKNRRIENNNYKDAFDISCDFFEKISKIAFRYDLVICLEPNPTCYECNFMINTNETAQVVNAVNHESLKMQFDTGSIIINNEDPFMIYEKYNKIIGHVHLSEPMLVPLGTNKNAHRNFYKVIPYLKNHILTIEMLTNNKINFLEIIENSIKVAIYDYCSI